MCVYEEPRQITAARSRAAAIRRKSHGGVCSPILYGLPTHRPNREVEPTYYRLVFLYPIEHGKHQNRREITAISNMRSGRVQRSRAIRAARAPVPNPAALIIPHTRKLISLRSTLVNGPVY
ncbi:hypothetical protein EVAR_89886_1 [Eumeta japonica]|uniref:Uncharacterized protein n=1 Tax=Eumeta variegata TaxID=151549 RepID=A0A4C1YWC1_EUMVA|nr:hypothetical protein EVAR_89886_1 [Eumeta japonica]